MKALSCERTTTCSSLLVSLMSLLLVTLWAGCQQATKESAKINPAGTYALISVDGNQLACTVKHEGHTMTIKSGRFVINPDGTCSSSMSLEGRDAPIVITATYTQDGPKLTMKWPSGGVTVGTVNGETFTMTNEGMVLAYRK